jgi:hypothetical protein
MTTRWTKRWVNLKLIDLTQPPQTPPEAVTLASDHQHWGSPPGGWLPVQTGVWEQLPGGVILYDPNRRRIAELQGLIFLTAFRGQGGRAQYEAIGDPGTWTVQEIVEV